MVSIKVLLFATFREKYGAKEVSLTFDGSIVGFLDALRRRFGDGIINDIFDSEAKRFRNNLIIMINGRNLKDIKEGVNFKDNDTVAIFPPVAGG
ncbi:MAG: MoaD family protein [Nitrososphaeria archaeon]